MGTSQATDNATLPQLRFRKLARALHNHGTGESLVAIGTRFGIPAETVGKIIAGEPGMHADAETIDRAAHEMDLHPDYFQVADLGEFTTHEHFVGGSPLSKAATAES